MPDPVARVDLTEALRALAGMRANGRKLTPAFRKLRKPLVADQMQHAKEQSGPDGKWKPLARATLAKRLAKKRRRHLGGRKKRSRSLRARVKSARRPILGKLPGAIKVQVFPSYIVGFSKADWSKVHQDGGRAGRSSRIPAREYYWPSETLVVTSARVILEHVVDGFKG